MNRCAEVEHKYAKVVEPHSLRVSAARHTSSRDVGTRRAASAAESCTRAEEQGITAANDIHPAIATVRTGVQSLLQLNLKASVGGSGHQATCEMEWAGRLPWAAPHGQPLLWTGRRPLHEWTPTTVDANAGLKLINHAGCTRVTHPIPSKPLYPPCRGP